MATPIFDAAPKTVNGSFNPATDHVTPLLGSLNLSAMPDLTALAGTTGTDAKLIHGDRWQQIDGNQTERVNKCLKTDIMQDENWEVHRDLTYRVDGTTMDERVKAHYQTNYNVRFDHFVHTRTETHDQPQIVHNPTEHTNWINRLGEWHYYKGSFNQVYVTANGAKFETDALETTGKVVVIQRQGFVNAWKHSDFQFTTLKNNICGFVSRIAATRTTAAVEHTEVEATVNPAPTAEDGLHLPI